MDHQSLRLFEPTNWPEEKDNPHLRPEALDDKVSYRAMVANLMKGEWQLWRLKEPAEGLAVTYPSGGKLFVYYLRGRGLFGTLKVDDLLDVALAEGCKGMAAETRKPGMLALLRRLGFKALDSVGGYTYLELEDGRQ